MKAKLPKAVWVGFDGEINPINTVCDKRNYRLCHRLARYHLHPGNEVKLKRENEWMRRWLRDLLTGKAGHFEMMAVIKPRMPDLFAGGKKGK